MNAQTQNKTRRRQASRTRQENDFTTDGLASCSLQPAAISRKVPVSLSTVAEAPSPPYEQIAARAYQLWEANGRPAGTDREDWFLAERLVRVGARGVASRPNKRSIIMTSNPSQLIVLAEDD